MPRISVIVPALDEAARVEASLDALAAHGFHEILVVDGGSRDDTAARARGRATVLACPSGRGRQLALGADHATGDILLFLHVDCKLPAEAAAIIEQTLALPRVVAGAFRTRHVLDGPARAWLPYVLSLADLRSCYTRLPYGDQALFVYAERYRAVGGYRPVPIFEDVDLARRLRQQGQIRISRRCVEVSARRYAAHPLRTAFFMNALPVLWRMGVSGERLQRWYGQIR